MQSSEKIEVKQFLNAWLGRQKFAPPEYETKGLGAGFRCQVRSKSFPNVFGSGQGQSKKEAMTNAARNFCWKMVEAGRMKTSEAPFLKVRRTGFQTDYRTIGDAQIRRDKIPSDPNFVDGDSGGWGMNNCEARLDNFIKTNNIAICKKFIAVGSGQGSGFIAEVSFTLQEPESQSEIEIYAREEAKTKQEASTKCALKVIQRLYQLQIIGPAHWEREKISSQKKAFPPTRPPSSESRFATPPPMVNTKPLKKVVRHYIDHDAVEQAAEADFDLPDAYQSHDETLDNNSGEDELGDWNGHETGEGTSGHQLIWPREEPIFAPPMGDQLQIRLRQEDQAGYWKFSGAVVVDQ